MKYNIQWQWYFILLNITLKSTIKISSDKINNKVVPLVEKKVP